MSGARTLKNDDRYVRMARTVTPENVSRVESLIKKDPKMTYAEIQDIMKISSGRKFDGGRSPSIWDIVTGDAT